MQTAVAVIPARAGSKRLPGKNVRPFLGLPLVAYSIRAAQRCRAIERVVVSTNDPAVQAIAQQAGAEVWWRPAELATDHASTFDVLRHVYAEAAREGTPPELLVLLQPTSPLRRASLIDDGLQQIARDARATSLISVFEQRRYTGRIVDGYYRPDFPENIRSQDIPPLYVPTGNLYIYRCRETILQGDALGAFPLALVEEAGTFVNIDDAADWQAMEILFRRHRHRFEYLLEEGEAACA